MKYTPVFAVIPTMYGFNLKVLLGDGQRVSINVAFDEGDPTFVIAQRLSFALASLENKVKFTASEREE